MPSAHAMLGPSASARWLVCPASVPLTKDLPYETTPHAEEGTRAHEEAERCLRSGENSDNAYVQTYVDYVRSLAEQPSAELYIEHRVPMGNVNGEENGFGTADAVVYVSDTKVLNVIDLKYGKGVEVDANGNTQLLCYALGVIDDLSWLGDMEKIRVTIVQPRLKPTASTWEVTREAIEEYRATFLKAGKRAVEQTEQYEKDKDVSKLTFCPTEKGCRWCRAKHECRAYAKLAFESAGMDFTDLDKPTNEVLSTQERAKIFALVPLVEAWASSFSKAILEDALNGVEFEGFKLVAGRAGARKWLDEESVDKTLAGMKVKKDDRYTKKLISPTQAEKLAKSGGLSDRQWKRLNDEYIVRPESKPALVPESDKRPALSLSATSSDFEALD